MAMNLNNPAFLQMASSVGGKMVSNPFYVTSQAYDAEFWVSDTKLGDFAQNLQYSLDNGASWRDLTSTSSFFLNTGESVYFRNKTRNSYSGTVSQIIGGSYKYDIGGDITELFYPGGVSLPASAFAWAFKDTRVRSASALILKSESLSYRCYEQMFSGCTDLIDAPELPATRLAESCYDSMFSGCTALTTVPELPATFLSYSCYNSMFSGCTALTTAPELPALSLSTRAYNRMFSGCTNLNTVICLAESGLGYDPEYEVGGTGDWLEGVSAEGSFTKTVGAEWPTGSSGIPENWTVSEVEPS